MICEICGTIRKEVDDHRVLENEKGEPCVECYEWVENEYIK